MSCVNYIIEKNYIHFFLRCQNYTTLRRVLTTELKNIDAAIMSLNENDLHVII